MEDIELLILQEQGWRFTKVEAGDKKPYPNNWQNNPLTLNKIPNGDNVGVILGEHSNGIMALDFDGPTSWQWFTTNIGCMLPTTVSWISGKDARCQMAFTVPHEYWPYLRTRKVTTKPGDKSIGLKPEQMEFRWNGAQSVLPPSVHPEKADGYNYAWHVSPSTILVAELPAAVLAWLLEQDLPRKQERNVTPGNIDTIANKDFEQLEAVLSQLKQYRPVLDYDTWLKVTFATAHEIGDAAAPFLLSKFWPEEEEGEYAAHLRGCDATRSPTMGTLIFMIKEHQQPIRKIKNNNKF